MRPGNAPQFTRAAQARTRHDATSSALVEALGHLDAALAPAVEHAEREFAPHAALAALRGLQISGDDVRRALRDASRACPMGSEAETIAALLRKDPRIERLVAECELDAVDLAILLIALAPEVDLRYQRI